MSLSPPYRSEGTATHHEEESDATSMAKTCWFPSLLCSLAKAPLHRAQQPSSASPRATPDSWMATLKEKEKKLADGGSFRSSAWVCSARAVTHSTRWDVLHQMDETKNSILVCLTKSQYSLGSAGAKAEFSTPFLG